MDNETRVILRKARREIKAGVMKKVVAWKYGYGTTNLSNKLKRLAMLEELEAKIEKLSGGNNEQVWVEKD